MAPGETVSPEQVAECRQKAISQMQDLVNAEGIAVEQHQLIAEDGDAFRVIHGVVQDKQPDLLVLGTSGQGGMKRMLLGSVAGRLLRELECDMLAVPSPE